MAYNNRWAYDSWPDSALPTGRDLNDLARSIKEWGWADTPGTKTVNANQNHLTNVGNLSFLGYLSGPSIRAAGAFGEMRLMQTGSLGFRWTLNNDGKLYLQRSTDSFASALLALSIDSAGVLGVPQSVNCGILNATVVNGSDIEASNTVTNLNGNYRWYMPGGGANNKRWDFISDASDNTLSLRAVNDGYSAAGVAVLYRRSGAAVTQHEFYTSGEVVRFTSDRRVIHAATPVYASNAAAAAAGLAVGTQYRTSTGQLMEVY